MKFQDGNEVSVYFYVTSKYISLTKKKCIDKPKSVCDRLRDVNIYSSKNSLSMIPIITVLSPITCCWY